MGCIIDFLIEFVGEIVFEGLADLIEKAYGNVLMAIINLLLFVVGIILLITGSVYNSFTQTILGWVSLGISIIIFIIAIILLIVKK